MKQLTDYIRTIPDFPQKGVMFRDITTLFNHADGLKLAVEQSLEALKGHDFNKIAGLEARGFMLGTVIAYKLGLPFTMIRKAGKLPGATIAQDYDLEYGTATIEIHDDAINAGDRILLVDDLIATGGTAEAGIRLIERLGGQVILAQFIIDLPALGGRKKIEAMGVPTSVLIAFDAH